MGKLKKYMEIYKYNLIKPNPVKSILAMWRIRKIRPEDFCPNREVLKEVYEDFPELRGDPGRYADDEIGGGKCQGWKKDEEWHWHRDFVLMYKRSE